MSFNNGKGRKRTATQGIVKLCCPLEESGVEVENISWIGLPPGGTTQEKRELAVGHSVLREIIVDYQGMTAMVADVFAYGTATIRGDVLKRRGFRCRSCNDHRVVHCAVLS